MDAQTPKSAVVPPTVAPGRPKSRFQMYLEWRESNPSPTPSDIALRITEEVQYLIAEIDDLELASQREEILLTSIRLNDGLVVLNQIAVYLTKITPERE